MSDEHPLSNEQLATCFLQSRAADHKDRLWKELEPRVRALAHRFARDDPNTEADLVQEAWVKYDGVLERWDPKRGVLFWTWFRTVLTNHFISWLRERREIPQANIQAFGQRKAEDVARRESLRRHVRIVLDSLRSRNTNDKKRRVKLLAFQFYYLEGSWGLEELAQKLGTVVSTIHRWLGEIRAEFETEWRRLYPEDLEVASRFCGRHTL